MIIAPSILTADFTRLKSEIDSIQTADMIHIDIMDGHFVPNISFGPFITEQISKCSELPLDVHLMVTDPMHWIDAFSLKKTAYITVHLESHRFHEAIHKIKSHHIKAGISIKPNTDVELILPYIQDVDLILVMTVEPGFGGQAFMADMMEKVRYLVELRKAHHLNFLIEIDGGVNDQTIQIAKAAGVDICVVGSHLFNQKDRRKGIRDLS